MSRAAQIVWLACLLGHSFRCGGERRQPLNLPRPIAVILAVAGFLVLINVFSGLHRIWFHWPVGLLLFIVILRAVLRRKPASNRKEERRRDRE